MWSIMCRLRASIRPVMWPCPSSPLARPTRRGACGLRSCRGSPPAPRSYLNYPRNSPNGCGYVPVPCHLRPMPNRTARESSTFPSTPADRMKLPGNRLSRQSANPAAAAGKNTGSNAASMSSSFLPGRFMKGRKWGGLPGGLFLPDNRCNGSRRPDSELLHFRLEQA